MKPLISIIVPVYNVESYVERCLEALSGQKYENLEIVIVDDGSTDKSGQMCDAFAKKEKRAKIYHKKNGGLSDARNFGLKKANGKIVAFVDSDDYVDKDYIYNMYAEMARDDADVVVCGFNGIQPKKERLSGEAATIQLLTEQENIDIVAWNKLYRKELFIKNEIWFPEGKKYEDSLTTYKILSKARSVVYLDESLYDYVERDESITKTGKTEDRLKTRELAAKEAIEFFDDDAEILPAAEISLLLSKFAYLDFAISQKIDQKYGEDAEKWIKIHFEDYKNNKYLTPKLKLYHFLLSIGLYKAFRKVRHE